MANVDIVSLLRRLGPQSGGDLARLMGVSRPTLMRAVRGAGEQVVAAGAARRTRYAARRALRGSWAPHPVFQVDEQGELSQLATLHLLAGDGCLLETPQALAFPFPLDGSMQEGWFEGLPYPLQDLRPQGFLGRAFAASHAESLQVSSNPEAWTDDDAVLALSLWGSDQPGNLIVGEVACRRWLERRHRPSMADGDDAADAVADDDRALAYPRRAVQALKGEVPGSSAGGEFPKFPVQRRRRDEVFHALVKFNEPDGAPAALRWADLLRCEHRAAEVLRDTLGVQASASEVVESQGRTYLEVLRFDRHGAHGRSAVLSLRAIGAGLLGQLGEPWPRQAQRLQAAGWLSDRDMQQVSLLWHFGKLIGNTDMHDGNLSFQTELGPKGPMFKLAPVYDMLPMLYAPGRGGELPPRELRPRPPLPAEVEVWRRAAQAAVGFWQGVADDASISAAFRSICRGNAASLEALITSVGSG